MIAQIRGRRNLLFHNLTEILAIAALAPTSS
jgi:hypothetical protein